MKEIVITRADLAALPEYSCSIPTGVVVGKRWRRDVTFGRRALKHHLDQDRPVALWVIGEYVACADPGTVEILWGWAVAEPGSVHQGAL
jgi:hypothetical protein